MRVNGVLANIIGGLNPPFVTSIQQVSITIASGSTSNTATISSVGANAFLIYQGETTDKGVASASIYANAVLTNSTTVTATRGSSNSDAVTINVVVVELASNLVSGVQAGTITITAGTSNTATISSVNTSLSAVFYLGETSTGTADSASFTKLALTNSTTVTASLGASGTTTVSYVVVTFTAAAIKSIQTFSIATSGASTTQTITSVNTANTIIAYGGSSQTAGAGSRRSWYTLTNSTTVTLSASSGTANTLNITVIEFNSGIFSQIQRGSISISASTSGTATITSAATAKSFVAMCGVLSGQTNPSFYMARITQTNATTLTATIGGSSSATVGYEIPTFN